MADGSRPAAGQTHYELRELAEGPVPLDLGLCFSSPRFADVVDAAIEFLGENDPDRAGTVAALEIVKVDGLVRETVWSYRHGSEPPLDPMRVFGFDVTSSPRGLNHPVDD